MSIQSFGKLNETRLRKFEADLALELPADYRRFLLQTNGGQARRVRVWLEELERWVAVDCFFGLGLKQALDLRAWAEEFEDALPPGALAIGSDVFGALLVLQTGGQDDSEEASGAETRAGIYLYDHAHQIEGSSDEHNAYWLAESWTALDDAMAEPTESAKVNPRAAAAAADHPAEDRAFAKKPADASFWVPGGIDQAKTAGKASLQVVDRLKQARFTHQGAFAVHGETALRES